MSTTTTNNTDKNNDTLPTTTTWLSLARQEIEQHQLDKQLYHVLCAFGGPHHAPGPATLDIDSTADDVLARQIETQLTTEIDADQAHMFARRFVAVAQLLSSSSSSRKEDDDDDNDATTTSTTLIPRLLRIGLFRRAFQILHYDAPPRALRIRALVDFIWSQALVLGQAAQLQHLPSLQALVASSSVDKEDDKNAMHEFAPGFRHFLITGATSGGPVHINVLQIQQQQPQAAVVRMWTVDARNLGAEDLSTLAVQHNATAAVSGGFFLYSEPDIVPPSRRTDPVGLLVTNGVVEKPPVFRRAALIQTADGQWDITTIGMDGVAIQIGNAKATTTATAAAEGGNAGQDEEKEKEVVFHGVVGEDGIRCVHRGHDKTVTLDKNEMGVSIVGRNVVEVLRSNLLVVDDKDTTTATERTMNVPLAGFVLIIPTSSSSSTTSTPMKIQPGDDVTYTLPIPNVQAAMAGGPVLYCADETLTAMDLPGEDFCGSAPPVTFSQDETFDNNLLPRMGAGLTADGQLVLAAIDGRNLDQALGLTLQGTADLLKSLGCVKAMNLDGGSSKRMYIRGKGVVCLSTTEIKAEKTDSVAQDTSGGGGVEKQRPVHSAILFLPPSNTDV